MHFICELEMTKKKKQNWEMRRKLTLSWLEGQKVLLASIPADVGVTVVEVAVPFAAVLHAQLVSVSSATVKIINRYGVSHQCATLAPLLTFLLSHTFPPWRDLIPNTITKTRTCLISPYAYFNCEGSV